MPKIDTDKLLEQRPENLNPTHETDAEFNKGWNACNEAWYNLVKNFNDADKVEAMGEDSREG